MEKIEDKSPIRKIFLLVFGLMVLFIFLKYFFNLKVDIIRTFSLESLIKILIGFIFIISTFLAYRHYNKS